MATGFKPYARFIFLFDIFYRKFLKIFKRKIISKGKHVDRYDKWHDYHKWIYCPIDIVENNMRSTNYPFKKLQFVKGDVNITLNELTPSQIAILRLDTDWYQSTKKELNVLARKISNGGFLIVDDYYAWQGSRKATDEFLSRNSKKFTVIDNRSHEPLILQKVP